MRIKFFSSNLFLYILTPVLFFLSFPPFQTSYLAFISFIPFFALLERTGFRSGFRHGYFTGLLTVGLFLYWINWNVGASQIQASGMYLSMVLYLALWWGLFASLQNMICRRFGLTGLIAAPFLWTVLEYAQSFGELGFPWHSLATTQTQYPPVIQFIQFTGMYGITWWLMAVNAALYLFIRAMTGPESMKGFFASPKRSAIVAAILILIPAGFSVLLYSWNKTDGERSVKIAVIQPNIEPNRKWLEREFAFNRLMEMTRSVRNKEKDLIIWPETAFPSRLRIDPFKKKTIIDELRIQNTRLLTGIPDKKLYADDDGEMTMRYFNSVFYINSDSVFESYDKIHLVPLGEYVPDFLFLIKDFAMDVGASNYAPGDHYTVFSLPLLQNDTMRFSSLVCYESVFSGLVRSFVRNGAEMIIIVTNDAWYDQTIAPEQHAYIAVLRAIEHQIPVIRCANSGVSCVIGPSGDMLASAVNPSEAIMLESVNLRLPGTFFTTYGDWFPLMCLVLSVGAVAFTVSRVLSGNRAAKD